MGVDGRDPFYYVKNFQFMLETLQCRDGDLLATEEWDFVVEFARLPTLSRALLVRMAMRKGPLFRASRLIYTEIPETAGAASPLLALHWVDASPRLSLDQLFRLLSKAELAEQLGLPRHSLPTAKASLLEELRAQRPHGRTFDEWCPASTDRIYELQIAGLCRRLTSMFFGNFRQKLSAFVLADMGIVKFERVPLHVASRPFSTRRQVDVFHQLHECRELLHGGAEPATVERALPAPVEDCEWLQERRDKLRFQLARSYERAGAVAEAAAIYATCDFPGARERALRLHDATSGRCTRRRVRAAPPPPEFVLTLSRREQGRPVERVVLDHLVAEEPGLTQVHYVENALINSLFGLLCWPAIFAPVPGAFFHAFHHGPADLGSARFFERRLPEFAECFAQLSSGGYKDTIRRRCKEKAGVASPFVAWGLLDHSLLETALSCFPAEHLRRLMQWIACDVRANRSGFPDLVQFWRGPGRYRLIEVKGPGDRLQDNQRRCLAHCQQHGIPVSLCHVRWGDAATPGSTPRMNAAGLPAVL